jgi:hypothetical protein
VRGVVGVWGVVGVAVLVGVRGVVVLVLVRPPGTRECPHLPPDRELRDGGRRDGDVPVRRADAAFPQGDGARGDRADPQLSQALTGAHDVGDRVERPHLVEVDVVRLDAVHPALRGRERAEGGDGLLPCPCGQVGGEQVGVDRAPGTVRG